MPHPLPPLLLLLAALALAGCDRGPDGVPPPEADAPPAFPAGDAMDDPAAPPPLDNPDEDVPPATVEDVPPGGLPAPGTITWQGFGSAAFGADQEAVRQSWGRDLGTPRPDEPGGCYYLIPQPQDGDGFSVAFMIEGDRFSRIDVLAPQVEAPGGGRVGMRAEDVERLHAGRVETLPHKYLFGARYLRIEAPQGEGSVLVFETTDDGDISQWRIGVPPQVDYVERCG